MKDAYKDVDVDCFFFFGIRPMIDDNRGVNEILGNSRWHGPTAQIYWGSIPVRSDPFKYKFNHTQIPYKRAHAKWV